MCPTYFGAFIKNINGDSGYFGEKKEKPQCQRE